MIDLPQTTPDQRRVPQARAGYALSFMVAGLLMLLSALPAQADPITFIAVHRGAQDPLTETNPDPIQGRSWVKNTGADTPDPDAFALPEENAWVIDDNTNGSRTGLSYSLGGTALELSNAYGNPAYTRGWGLMWSVNVPDHPTNASGGGVFINLTLRSTNGGGDRRYMVRMGAQSDGDPVLDVLVSGTPTTQTITLEGFGSGYHRYLLLWDPDDQAATLTVDGQVVLTGYTGRADANSGLQWGSQGNSSSLGEGRWSEVVFFLGVPEPASLACLMLAAPLILRRRTRPVSAAPDAPRKRHLSRSTVRRSTTPRR